MQRVSSSSCDSYFELVPQRQDKLCLWAQSVVPYSDHSLSCFQILTGVYTQTHTHMSVRLPNVTKWQRIMSLFAPGVINTGVLSDSGQLQLQTSPKTYPLSFFFVFVMSAKFDVLQTER